MAIKATEVKPGNAIIYEGELCIVLRTEHVKPGKGPAYIQAKMRNVATGSIKVNRLNSSDKFEAANIDRRKMEYLYDGGGQGKGPFVFMDTETYDQIELSSSELPIEQSRWLKENTPCTVQMHAGKVLGVELPAAVELAITETVPQPKGATATNQLKEATLETGAIVRVPPFCEVGQVVRINTETGEYLGKA
ncbi:MAG: elongation factor P [Phycisphaerales bacterium]|nr:elongation factor P [Phycisphaerales bacterium]